MRNGATVSLSAENEEQAYPVQVCDLFLSETVGFEQDLIISEPNKILFFSYIKELLYKK